jgi:hypothetical protein
MAGCAPKSPSDNREDFEKEDVMELIPSPLRRWVCGMLLFYGLGLIGLVGCNGPYSEPSTKRSGKSVAQLVDDIRNRNKPPKLVERSKGRPRTLALFQETYDWKEDKRVLKALNELYQEESADLWEKLVRIKKDKRYCVTLVIVKTDDAEVYTVGDICFNLAYDRLVGVFQQHLPPSELKEGPLVMDIGIEDLGAWRKKRAEKPLYQLQIEVCQLALRALPKYIKSKDQQFESRIKIAAEIMKLTNQKKPVFLKYHGFHVSYGQPAYDATIAKWVREIIKSGSTEDLDIVR